MDGFRNYIDLFEDTEPPEKLEYKTPQQIREEERKNKMEEHKAKNKELATSCKKSLNSF